MGMPIVVDVRDDVSDATLDEVFDWFREVDERFSTYKEGSEISRLNRNELALRDCHPDVRAVLARCDELREATNGFFDARYASLLEVDPSGLVKGWSVDRAGELLEAARHRQLLDQRGRRHPDTRRRASRDAPGARASSIRRSRTASRRSSRRPTSRSRPPARTSAASTSSTRTRASRRRVCSRSRSQASELATADALATAIFAMGERRPGLRDGDQSLRGLPDPRGRQLARHRRLSLRRDRASVGEACLGSRGKQRPPEKEERTFRA